MLGTQIASQKKGDAHIIIREQGRDICCWAHKTTKLWERYHKISKHASLISQRRDFLCTDFLKQFFSFSFLFQKFSSLLRIGIIFLIIIFIDYIFLEFSVKSISRNFFQRSLCERQKCKQIIMWFKNDVHNENHVKITLHNDLQFSVQFSISVLSQTSLLN